MRKASIFDDIIVTKLDPFLVKTNVKIIIWVSGYLGFLNGIQRFLLPLALINYGWDIASYGTVYFVQAFAMSIPLLLGGISTDLQGRKPTVLISIVTFIVGVFYFSQVISGVTLLPIIIAQVITTISFGITRMGLSIQIADETEDGIDRTSSLGIQSALRNFLGMIGPLLFGIFLDFNTTRYFDLGNYELGFVILAVLGLLGFLFALKLPKLDPERIKRNRATSIADMPENHKKMQFAFGIEEIILGFTSGLIVPFIDFYLIDFFSPTNFQWGVLTATGRIGISLGSYFAGKYGDGFGKSKLVFLFNMIVPFVAAGIAFGQTFVVVSIFYVLRVTVANLIHPVWKSWYFKHVLEQTRGRLLSIIRLNRRLSRSFGTLAGPFVFGLLGPLSFPIACVFYPIAMAIPAIVEKKIEEEEEEIIEIIN